LYITLEAAIEIERPAEEVFDLAVDPQRLPAFLKKRGLIPGVEKAEMEGGVAPAAGTRRCVSMADGSTLVEEIVTLDRPSLHRYRWATRPPMPFALLIRGAEASWTLVPQAAGTRFEWRYRLELTTPLAYPVAAPVSVHFKGWMAASLRNLRGLF
jgi:uncharacterized protein YndB with AHSA1/START domain